VTAAVAAITTPILRMTASCTTTDYSVAYAPASSAPTSSEAVAPSAPCNQTEKPYNGTQWAKTKSYGMSISQQSRVLSLVPMPVGKNETDAKVPPPPRVHPYRLLSTNTIVHRE